MMGQHSRSESLFYYFRIEDQVPENHLLRLIDRHISFDFVREKLKDSYSDTGRPSIDSGTPLAHSADRLSVWRHQRAQTGRGTADASGLALVYRTQFRSGNSPSLHVSQEPSWTLSGVEPFSAAL